MNDAESKMTMFTTAKAVSIQQAEEKCQRYKVGYCFSLIKRRYCWEGLSNVCVCVVSHVAVMLNSNIFSWHGSRCTLTFKQWSVHSLFCLVYLQSCLFCGKVLFFHTVNISEDCIYETTCLHLLSFVVSGGSHQPARVASKCFERECSRVRADHL